MPLDIARIKARQKETKGGGDRWRPEEGTNTIRVFKFVHKVTPEDVKNGFFAKDLQGKNSEELDRPFILHFGLNKENRPVMSTPELMKQYERFAGSSDTTDQAQADKIKPQTKYALNIVDTSEKPRKMRHWLMPKSVYNKILSKVADEDYKGKDGELGGALLGSVGRDFKLVFDPKQKGVAQYDIQVRDADKCAKLSSELADKVIDFYSAKGMQALGFLGEEAKEEKKAKPVKKEDPDELEKPAAEETEEKDEVEEKAETAEEE